MKGAFWYTMLSLSFIGWFAVQGIAIERRLVHARRLGLRAGRCGGRVRRAGLPGCAVKASTLLGVIALLVLVLSGCAAELATDAHYAAQARLVAAVVAGLGAGFGALLAILAAEEAANDVRQ